MKSVLISGKDICKNFPSSGSHELILNHVDVKIYEGDFTIIMGESGAGKSTLLYALSGMDRVTNGTVAYRGKEISDYNEKQMAKLRSKHFGFVFQQTHLVSNLTLFENVVAAGYLAKERNEKEVRKRANDLLSQMHVEKAKDRFPFQTSGGEAQRAAVARAVMNQPDIVFADEPTGALNKQNSEEVMNLFTKLNQAGQSILMVTHDLRAAIRGNRILYLEDGKILDQIVLPAFTESKAREREAMVNEWLVSLSW